MSEFELNMKIKVSDKDIRKAQALMGMDISTDDELKAWNGLSIDLDKVADAAEQMEEMKLFGCIFGIAELVDEGVIDPGDTTPVKSKFQQRLEEAQRLQNQKLKS